MQKQLEFPNGLSRLNPDGSETLDPTPVELPVGFKPPETIQDLIKRLVTDPMVRAGLEAQGAETFDEADDFDIPDDMPVSPHEDNFDPQHLLSREMEINSATVQPLTAQEVQAARDAIAKLRNPGPKASVATTAKQETTGA